MSKKTGKTKSRIHLLPPDVSAKIAAGEVLERPASAVRELLDNALDAGADRIKVEIRDGGKKLIKIEDNGCGMTADELALSVEKHATSKIATAEDIFAVASLGFRGEALHATAAVSRLRIVSNNGDGAHELCVEGGKQLHLREAAGVKGTLVEISKLFFNTPARREFLRSNIAEMRAVKKIVMERMVAFPDVAFRFIVDGKTVFESRSGSLRDRVGDLFGNDKLEQLVSVTGESDGLNIEGLVSTVHFNTSSRKDQFFILNGRPVFTPSLSHALQGAYDNMLAGGRYPFAFLHLSIDPSEVNVNIHPDKREVRFRNEQAVYALVRSAVKHGLQDEKVFASVQLDSIPEYVEKSPSFPDYSRPDRGSTVSTVETSAAQRELFTNRVGDRSGYPIREPVAKFHRTSFPHAESHILHGVFTGYSVAGSFMRNYWILEKDDTLLMVDQHAVHERVLYEKFKNDYFSGGVPTQGLLVPVQIYLSPAEVQLLDKHADTIKQLGFTVENFGPEMYAIQEVPERIKGDEADSLKQLFSVLDGNSKQAANEKTERMLSTLACRSAVKQGDIIQERELVTILNQLSELETPFSCPHGRPAIVELNKEEIEKWFKRR